jgi:predicted secreted hydrolase
MAVVFIALVMIDCSLGGASGSANVNATATTSEEPSTWREAEAGYQYFFPRDHAAHPDYRVEWWYYTGNLTTKSGRRFGFQLTFFRTGIDFKPSSPSRWAVRDLYMAHFAISDIDRAGFRSFERINRAGIGWAGADPAAYRVWNEDWEAHIDGKNGGNDHMLSARADGQAIELRLTPGKPPVIHGVDGISQKGPSQSNASHYYSMTRLKTTGSITVDGQSFDVTGLSWMDHEFGSSFLEQEQVGWDWFSIQLADGRDLMIFQIRRADGSMDPRSSGTIVDQSGRAVHIPFGEFALRADKSDSGVWHSPASSGVYPIHWTVEAPGYDLKLDVRAAIPNQELLTPGSTGVTYWEGSVVVRGSPSSNRSESGATTGSGYLEMTGYSGPSMGAILR